MGARFGLLLALAACAPRDAPGDDDPAPPVEAPTCERVIPPPALPAAPEAVALRPERLSAQPVECVMIEDLDGDGRIDLTVVEPSNVAVVRTWYGTDTPRVFDEVTVPVPGTPGSQLTCALRDLDGDGHLDVLYGTPTGAHALLSDGARGFVDGGEVVRLPDHLVARPRNLTLFLAPIDLDGRPPLDLVYGLQGSLDTEACEEPDPSDTGDVILPEERVLPGEVLCYVAEPDGIFRLAPEFCPRPMLADPPLAPHGALVADLDDDGDADLFSANDFGTNRVFLRGPDGLEVAEGTGLEVYDHAMGLALEDFDGDGLRDWYVTDVGGDSLYLADDCLRWVDAGRATGTVQATRGTVTWGTAATDLDGNGAPDLVVYASLIEDGRLQKPLCGDGPRQAQPPLLVLLNEGGGFSRQDVPLPQQGNVGSWRAQKLVRGDLDGDLREDFVLTLWGGVFVVWNDGDAVGPVLRVRALEPGGAPAYGARITVRVSEGARRIDMWPSVGWNGQGELTAHAALGSASGPATVEVRWPDGHVTEHGPFEPGQRVDLRRDGGGEGVR